MRRAEAAAVRVCFRSGTGCRTAGAIVAGRRAVPDPRPYSRRRRGDAECAPVRTALSMLPVAVVLWVLLAAVSAHGGESAAPTPEAFAALLGDARPTVRVEPLTAYPDEKTLPKFLFECPVERYVVEYANGYAFSSLLIRNTGKNLLIYNHGHDPTFKEGFSREFLKRYLRSGGSLLLTWMPLRDPRFPPDAPPLRVRFRNTEQRVPVRTTRHEVLTLFDTEGYHFFRYFLDPILLPLGRVSRDYESIFYVGLSGGGWTGLILSALNPPVRRYVLVAGFLPEEGRASKADLGDVEQITPSVFRRFPYRFFLEQLDAKGPAASWIIYNTEDDCCYRAVEHEALIRRMERTYGNIHFEIRDSTTHSYSPDRILELVAPGAPGYSWWERLFE